MANLVSEKNISRFNVKNIEDLNSVLVERRFGRPEDYIEVHIYDLNNTLLDTISNYTRRKCLCF